MRGGRAHTAVGVVWGRAQAGRVALDPHGRTRRDSAGGRAGGRAHPVAAHVAEHLEAAVRVVRAVVPAGLDHLIYPQFEVIRAIMLDDSPYVLHEQSTHRLDEAHHPQPDPRQCRDLEVNRRLIIPNKRQGKRRDMWHQPARRERKRVCGSGG